MTSKCLRTQRDFKSYPLYASFNWPLWLRKCSTLEEWRTCLLSTRPPPTTPESNSQTMLIIQVTWMKKGFLFGKIDLDGMKQTSPTRKKWEKTQICIWVHYWHLECHLFPVNFTPRLHDIAKKLHCKSQKLQSVRFLERQEFLVTFFCLLQNRRETVLFFLRTPYPILCCKNCICSFSYYLLFRAEYKPRGYYLELWPQL